MVLNDSEVKVVFTVTLGIDYRGAHSTPGLETPIVYVERCGPRHDEIIIVPVTRKRLNTFCSYFTHRIVIINYITSY